MEQVKVPPVALRFLAVAQQDLAAAQCLYDNRCYPQAVFYLEQSVEKGLKSFALCLGIITEEEAHHRIGHRTMNIYIKTTDQFKQRVDAIHSDPKLERMFEGIVDVPRLSDQMDRALKFIRDASQETPHILSNTDKRLRNYLTGLKKIHRDYENLQTIIQQLSISESEFREFKKIWLGMIGRYMEDRPEEFEKFKQAVEKQLKREDLEKITKESLTVLIPPIFIYTSFLYLSRLLASHVQLRYPNADFDPLEFYTPQMPLIRKFPQLRDYAAVTLKALEQLYAPLRHGEAAS